MPINLIGGLLKMSNSARKYQDQIIDKVQETKDKLVVVSKDVAKKVDKQAHKKPWLFVAIAAAFSAFFGLFLGRKFKKQQ